MQKHDVIILLYSLFDFKHSNFVLVIASQICCKIDFLERLKVVVVI